MLPLEAVSHKNNVSLFFANRSKAYKLERKMEADGPWLILTDIGWEPDETSHPCRLIIGNFIDMDVAKGLYQYRAKNPDETDDKYLYSLWVRCDIGEPIGWSFGNYTPPDGLWGEILTPDDLRFSYFWGQDLRGSNGQSFTDEQLMFFVEEATEEIARRLNITIKKTRIACDPQDLGLEPGEDYDDEEGRYPFRRERIQRSGMITTRKRPVISISRLDLLAGKQKIRSLLDNSTLDKTKGLIRFFDRPLRSNESIRALHNSVLPYGADTYNSQLFYAIDYVAGYESAAKVPKDLRAAVGKKATIELMGIIGDGLMSGFSSSSLSMDGVSESFSSTQSATSAYMGARIKQCTDELDEYIKANKLKFSNVVVGAL
jgi:hypothetical protein